MKKYFITGFLTGFLGAGFIIVFLYARGSTALKETLFYEEELADVEGYNDLSDEEKGRIEVLKGEFEVGEIIMYSRMLNREWYNSVTDVLVKEKIFFQDISNVGLLGEHYRMKRISSDDAEYYQGFSYIGIPRYFGEKSVVTCEFRSLDNERNAFILVLTANGNVFMIPGGTSDYGEWGIYSVYPYEEGGV